MIGQTSNKKKWIYASPRLGINLFMGLIDFALLFLYEDVYELNAILVGTALMLGKLSAGIFQFIIPWISDHTSTKYGRRKPFLIIMAPILSFSFMLLILPGVILGANPPEMTLFAWFATFNVIAQGSYAMTTIYHSWTAEQFPVDERPKVSQYQNIFNFAAMAITIVFSFMVLTGVKDDLIADPTKIPTIFLVNIIIFTIVMISLTYFCTFYMPVEKTPKYETKFKVELKQLLKNKNYLNMTLIQGFSSLAWAMINAVLLGYIDTVLDLHDLNLYIVAVLLMICLFWAVGFWRKRIEKKGKKKTLMQIFLIAIFSPPFSLIGFFAFSRNIIFGLIFAFLIALMQSGWALFPYIIYADLAEDAEKKNGELKTGLYTGFPSLILNIFQAISLQLTGWLLSLGDISNGGTNSFSLGYVLWGPICTVFFIVTFYYIKRFVTLDFDWEKNKSNQDKEIKKQDVKK